MFTGIIETLGLLESVSREGENLRLRVQTPLTSSLKIDQSLAHNGICLTVVNIHAASYEVIAVKETIEKTNIEDWQIGDQINLERALKVGDRLDGHFVQGHVDAVGELIQIEEKNGSHHLRIEYPSSFDPLLIEKGSVALQGISLTCFNLRNHSFELAIIPYTWQHTNLHALPIHGKVNLEFDVLGKYFLRHQQLQ